MPDSQIKVDLIEKMGGDLTVVNAARCSFDKESEWGNLILSNDEYAEQEERLDEEGWRRVDTFYNPYYGHEFRRLKEKDKKLIQYLAKHVHMCYDDQTEIFTDSGWKFFKDLNQQDRVAEVSPEEGHTLRFRKPDHYYKGHYEGEMILCETSTVNYCVTPNHRMYFRGRDSESYKDWEVKEAREVLGKVKNFQVTATIKQFPIHDASSFEEGWFKGFMLADGYKDNQSTVGFRLKKIRKIVALERTIKVLGLKYTKTLCKDGATQFRVKTPLAKNLKKSVDKTFEEEDFSKTSDFIKGAFEGLLEGDGSVKHKGWVFSSNSEKLVSDLERLATLCGYSSNRGATQYNLNNPSYKTIVLSRHQATVNKSRGLEEVLIPYKGTVYCVTVPSGLLLVRRKGKQFVCGNSPFGHCFASFRVEAPIFVARQLVKHKFLRWNEVSRRYVDSPPVLFTPDVWRGKADDRKQGSAGEAHISEPVGDWLGMSERDSLSLYESLIRSRVCPEQARMVLPQSTMTTWWWSGSLDAFAAMCHLRCKEDTQYETRLVANQIDEIMGNLYPVSWESLRMYAE